MTTYEPTRGAHTRVPAGSSSPARRMLPVATLLLESPDREAIGHRLTTGHGPDDAGRCRHPAHQEYPESHPCSILRVVTMVDRLAEAVSDVPVTV